MRVALKADQSSSKPPLPEDMMLGRDSGFLARKTKAYLYRRTIILSPDERLAHLRSAAIELRSQKDSSNEAVAWSDAELRSMRPPIKRQDAQLSALPMRYERQSGS